MQIREEEEEKPNLKLTEKMTGMMVQGVQEEEEEAVDPRVTHLPDKVVAVEVIFVVTLGDQFAQKV